MKRWVTSLLAVLLLAPAASAQVTVELWHSYRARERQALEKTIADFNTSHPDILIKTTFVPYDAYLDKLTAAIPRGHGPDVFIAAHDRIGGWADSGHIAPLDEYTTKGLLKRFFKKTVDPLIYRRQLYGLPVSFKSAALFYNRALVKQPPADTTEMIDLARDLTGEKNAEGQQVYGLVYEHSDLYFHAGWLFGFKGSLFDARQNLVLDSQENAESLRFAARLVHDLKLAPQDVTGIKVTTLFNTGRAAMVINGPWFRGEIEEGVDYGVALLPEISQSGMRARPFVGSEAFMLSAQAKNPEQAFVVMETLTRDRAARVRMRQGFQPVANLSLYDDPEAQADPVLTVFRDR
jgi:maltose-binding protein MalE